MPRPIRWQCGEMEPDTIQFDGKTIQIQYHENRQRTRGWWDGTALHEINWFPVLKHPDAVITHYVQQLPVNRRRSKREQKERILNQSRFTKCGKGLRVKFTTDMAGLNVAGGLDAIYLISQNGTHGALRLWSSKYQSYSLRGFKVGAIGEWPELLMLSEKPIVVDGANTP